MKYFLIILTILIVSCSGKSIVDSKNIKKDFSHVKSKISRNRNFISELKDRRVGNSGYYYILNREGVIIFHPQTVLSGQNFSKYSFIKKILENESGCFTYNMGNIERVIYFQLLNVNEILCLAIQTNEVVDSAVFCEATADKIDN